MGDPICKWRAARPHNIVELVQLLPHTSMQADKFRRCMEERMPGFNHTPYQLACQLGLYYIDADDIYHPRFPNDIDETQAEEYLRAFVSKYYVPNPYTARGFKNLEKPILLELSLVEYLEKVGGSSDFEQAMQHLLKEEVGNLTATKTLLSYSQLLVFNKNDVSLHPNYKTFMELSIDRNDKAAFFHGISHTSHIRKNDQPLQVIYYGAPGTGKSYTIDSITKEENSIRTTFHPDSDYASFVGSYKPTMESVPMSAFVGKEVHVAQPQGEHLGLEKKIVYKFVPQAFLKAYVEAWRRYAEGIDNPFYLIIEEINRGNCAQIFGDLFQLLDRNNHGSSSYAISADEDIAQFLKEDKRGFLGFSDDQKKVISQYILYKDNGENEPIGSHILDGSKLLLPPNMRVWATMNTSDQSLFPIDSAFKRRWNWEYMPIEYDKKDWRFAIGDKQYSWGEFLKLINPKIAAITTSEDKQMGYFFAKPDRKSDKDNPALLENDVISEKVFVNKVLFYLWTDVFKDYDLTEEPFVYEEDNVRKAFHFTDFFPVENNPMLAKFIDGLGLQNLASKETEQESDIAIPATDEAAD